MTSPRCRYRRAADLGLVELDSPGTGNAVDADMTHDLLECLERARQDEPRLLVLASTSPVFCAGVNLPAMRDGGLPALAGALRGLLEVFHALHQLPFPTASLVNGAAIGSGGDLATATDLRFGTERARFAFPGVGFGLLFGTHRLHQLVGADAVHRLVLLGRRINAHEALRCGLLTELTNDADALLESAARRISGLTPEAVTGMLSVTRTPTLDGDRRLLEESLAQPDLFDRFLRFATERGFGSPSRPPIADTAARGTA